MSRSSTVLMSLWACMFLACGSNVTNQSKPPDKPALIDGTVLDWQRAGPDEKAACCVEIIRRAKHLGRLTPAAKQQADRDVQGMAKELVGAMDAMTKPLEDGVKNAQAYADEKVAATAAQVLIMAGSIKR